METGTVNDKIVSDNGDSEKVLATVALTIRIFTAKNPEAYIIVIGTNEARTRLYRMAISKYLEKIIIDYTVYGLPPGNSSWLLFQRNAEYEAFMLQRKIIE